MTYAADPRVDAYIGVLPDWQQAICREVRDLVHAADRDVTETIKRTNRPYFVLQGNICALLAAKDHVNVFRPPGRNHQRARPHRHVQAHHCQQPSRRLAQIEAGTLSHRPRSWPG
jgi:hypothetical protein